MITSEFTDKDGFRLQFDETCSEPDKKFFREQYPKVDLVANERLHCTTCDIHIGTAPISEKIIRTHQVLGVTQCNKCFAFYNSGEFGKGEDGSEYYCRWCGQGGEVFCCSTCPFVFCNKCIRSNLTSSYVKQIEENDDWSCFVCDKKILQKQRGHHWALRNFMNKQLEKIQKINITSEDDLNNLLNEDVSTCCPRRKRKSLVKPVVAPVKRPSMNGGYMSSAPPAKKISIQPPPRQIRMPLTNPYRPTAPKPGPLSKRNDEIVCTPDIMGLFNDNNEDSSNMQPSTSSSVPPPLVMRNNQRAVRPPQPAGAQPIYHNVNGFQIDLNHAARQEIFRLPNGKLIQVRKQTGPPAPQGPLRPGMPVAPTPRGPQFTIRQAGPNATATRPAYQPRAAPQPRQRFNSQPQARFTFTDGRVVASPIAPSQPPPVASTVFTQQNGSISVARAPQPPTPFGAAKTEFEDKIISGMEICQHTINKMITLTNSTSFKTSVNFKDLKDLYIHLQYLFTYTSGKFQTLQESLKTGMESLAKFDVNLKEKADDDELEIVEEKQDVIEVMSDDDEQPTTKEGEKSAPAVKKPLLKHIQYTNTDSAAGEGSLQDAEKAATEAVRPPPPDVQITPEISEIMESDKKLMKKVLVKVEKLENTKNPIIKQYIAQMQARQEVESENESREGSPMNLFEPMVMLEEDAGRENTTGEKSAETGEKPAENSDETEAAKVVDGDVVEVPSDDEDDIPAALMMPEQSMEVDGDNNENVANKESQEDEQKTGDAEKSGEDLGRSSEAETEKPTEVQVSEIEKSTEVDTVVLDDSITEEVKSAESEVSSEKPEESEKTAPTEKPEIDNKEPEQNVENGQSVPENPESFMEDQQTAEEVPDIPQTPPENIDTSQTNGFIDCPTNGSEMINIAPLGDKHVDDLPTIDEVTSLVASEMADDSAMLEDLFNELENSKTTAMEVD